MSFDARTYWQDILGNPDRRPPATAFVNFELIGFDPEAGWCEAAFLAPSQAANPGGNVQGGPAMSPTLQMTTSFIRPVPMGVRLIGRGQVVRQGRAAIFTEGWLRNESGDLLAQATASCIPRAMDWS